MENNFIENIRGFIPKRKESVDELAAKVLLFLTSLNKIDENLFSDWYEQGMTKKQVLEKKVIFEKEYLSKIIEKEWDKKFPDLGCNFTFWTRKESDSNGAAVSFRIGLISDNNNLNNRVIISLPTSQSLQINKNDERTIKIEKLIKDIWDAKKVEIDFI